MRHPTLARYLLGGGTERAIPWEGAATILGQDRAVQLVTVMKSVEETWGDGKTAQHAFGAVKRAFSWLNENPQRIIREDPAARVKNPFKNSETEPHPLPLKFFAQEVLPAAGEMNSRYRRTLLAIYFTGMRPISLRRLRWVHIREMSTRVFAAWVPKTKKRRYHALWPEALS